MWFQCQPAVLYRLSHPVTWQGYGDSVIVRPVPEAAVLVLVDASDGDDEGVGAVTSVEVAAGTSVEDDDGDADGVGPVVVAAVAVVVLLLVDDGGGVGPVVAAVVGSVAVASVVSDDDGDEDGAVDDACLGFGVRLRGLVTSSYWYLSRASASVNSWLVLT